MLDNCNKNFTEGKFRKGVYAAFNTKEIDRWCLGGWRDGGSF